MCEEGRGWSERARAREREREREGENGGGGVGGQIESPKKSVMLLSSRSAAVVELLLPLPGTYSTAPSTRQICWTIAIYNYM